MLLLPGSILYQDFPRKMEELPENSEKQKTYILEHILLRTIFEVLK